MGPITRVVLSDEINTGDVDSALRERVESICKTASRLGIEVVLHGRWVVIPEVGTYYPNFRPTTYFDTKFNAGPPVEGDLWIGSRRPPSLSLDAVELLLLRRLVEKLETEAALVARASKGRQVLYREYFGYEAASSVDRDVAEALNGPDLDGNFQGTLLLEVRYVDPSPPPPQVDLPPPPSAKRTS